MLLSILKNPEDFTKYLRQCVEIDPSLFLGILPYNHRDSLSGAVIMMITYGYEGEARVAYQPNRLDFLIRVQ